MARTHQRKKHGLQSKASYIQRWSRALWNAQVEVGLCTTPEPITNEMKAIMRKAAEAAYNVVNETGTISNG